MSADGSPGPSGAWKPPPAFKFGPGFQPKPPAVVAQVAAQPTSNQNEETTTTTKRVILRPKSTNPAPLVSPPKETNGAMARARLQAKPAAKFTFSPPKAVDEAAETSSRKSRTSTAAADTTAEPIVAPVRTEMREDIEFSAEMLDLVHEIKLRAGSAPDSPTTTHHEAVAAVCSILSPTRENSTVLLVNAAVRIPEFLDAFSKLPTSEMLWFMHNRGYEVLLHLSHDPSSEEHQNEPPRKRYRTKLSNEPGAIASLWDVMRASFSNGFAGSAPARGLFTLDVEHLALRAGLPAETVFELAKEYPALRRACGHILIKMHAAQFRDGAPVDDSDRALLTLAALLRLCTWSLASSDDDLVANDSASCSTACALLNGYLQTARCPAAQVPVVAEFTLAVLRAGVRSFLGKAWVVELLETVLGQADALSERVGWGIAREELLKLFATALPIGLRDQLAFTMVELLLIPYLPDGSERKLPRITKPAIDVVVKMLFTAGRSFSFAYPLAMLHLSATLAQGIPSRPENRWAVVPCAPTTTGFLPAARSALVKCMEGYKLPAVTNIPMRDYDRNALLQAVEAKDAAGCTLLVSCGWDPYLESTTSQSAYGTAGHKHSAFIKAVMVQAWDVVRVFLRHPPEPINRLFVTDVIEGGVYQVMPALARLASAGQTNLMRILLGYQPSVAAHRNMGEAISPIHAAVHGSLECVSLLLAHGANLKEPVVDNALHGPHLLCAILCGKYDIARFLLDQHMPVDHEHKYLSAAYGFMRNNKTRVEMMRLLLSKGADPMEVNMDGDGEVLLQRAMLDTNAQVARLLLDFGAQYTPITSDNEADPFWIHSLTRHSNPSETVRLIIGHNLPCEFRGMWTDYSLDFLFYPGDEDSDINRGDEYNDIKEETLVRVMEVLLEFDYFSGAELVLHGRESSSLARALDMARPESRPLAQLLIDYGCSPGERQIVDEDYPEDHVDLVDYVPTKRVPTSGTRYKVKDQEYHYIPWRPALHPYTPRIFRYGARSIAHLRLLGDATTANESLASSAVAFWASLPLEIFEIIVNELYQHVRASVGAASVDQVTAGDEAWEEGDGEEDWDGSHVSDSDPDEDDTESKLPPKYAYVRSRDLRQR